MARRCTWSAFFVVIVTPFNADGSLDEGGARALADLLVARDAMPLDGRAASVAMGAAAAIQAKIGLLHQRMSRPGDHPRSVLKARMARLGIPSGPRRPPVLPVEEMAGSDALVAKFGLRTGAWRLAPG